MNHTIFAMKYHIYNILLWVLRLLVFLKRAIFWVGRRIWHLFGHVNELYNKTLGFWLYKLWHNTKRLAKKHKIPLDKNIISVFGKRGVLQIVLGIVIFGIMFPHSKLYTKEATSVPGHDTVLYSLVGPGDHVYGTDVIIIEEAHFQEKKKKEDAAWRTGAVTIGRLSMGKEFEEKDLPEISGITAGGTAITKPDILPGSELPVKEPSGQKVGEKQRGRSEVIVHTVQTGDVIGAIAEQYNISVNTILWANNLSFRSYIRPGDKLKILPGTGLLHTVVRGDTVGKIANKYDSKISSIVRANKLKKDGSDIVVGEELFVPEGTKPRVYVPRSRPRSSSANRVSAPPPSVDVPAGVNYVWPTSCRRITQYYGWRHTGIDVGCGWGAPLIASKAGKVIKSQCGWNGGYGCYVILDHGGGVTTLYAHARKLYVSAGERVAQGQTLAEMGSTGRSTGPHIHYEVRVNGRRQNPLKYVR